MSEAHNVHHYSLLHVFKHKESRLCFISDFILKLNCGKSCKLLSECTQHTDWMPSLLTIQTLLLWKALSFLLCAGKHHWEHEQNTSKQDTNSCCAAGYMGKCLSPYACDSEGKSGDKTPLIMAFTTLTTRNEAYSIMYRTCSLLYMSVSFFF